MSFSTSMVAVILAFTSFASPQVEHFPGSFFEALAKPSLQRQAMEQWPGPSQIVVRWQTGELDRLELIAILLGASASHDPVLLPLYRDAILSEDDEVRVAAAYGYRDLLGDAPSNLSGGVDLKAAERLAIEIDAVAKTLRERPLVEFWLQAALMDEGNSMPGWRGAVLRRPQGVCLRALDQIITLDDFHYLGTAFRIAETKSLRLGLMHLLEAISLQEFFVKPKGAQAGWGAKNIDEALEATEFFVDNWIDVRCSANPSLVLRRTMSSMGVRGVDPLATNSYEFWLQVLKRGPTRWRVMASRRLYELGGRWSQLSMLQTGSEKQAAALDELVDWYLLRPAHIRNRNIGNPPALPRLETNPAPR